MNKNPVFLIITALSVIGLVIAISIFTRLRMQNEAAINESQQGTPAAVEAPREQAPQEQAPAEAPAH